MALDTTRFPVNGKASSRRDSGETASHCSVGKAKVEGRKPNTVGKPIASLRLHHHLEQCRPVLLYTS